MNDIPPIHSLVRNTSATLGRLRKRLERAVGRAIEDYNLIEPDDVVLCCVSGGKDSHAMLALLMALRERSPVPFRLIALNVDQKQPGFPEQVLPQYLEALGVDYRIVEADTYSIVREKIPLGKTTCSLCSRLRRGVVYRVATELGATKIALGHHRDDIVETFFLNLFFGGRAKAMAPKLKSDDGRHMVIRPLAYCRERDIAARGGDDLKSPMFENATHGLENGLVVIDDDDETFGAAPRLA